MSEMAEVTEEAKGKWVSEWHWVLWCVSGWGQHRSVRVVSSVGDNGEYDDDGSNCEHPRENGRGQHDSLM